jgi:putative ABC transport system ATP-binding protein
MNATVVLEAVTKSFVRGAGSVDVLRGVDLTVAPGEIVMIKGRSGTGKTTLLSILAGWLDADSGSVQWHPDIEPDPGAWHNVAVIPQTLGMLRELTVKDNVALPYRLGTAPDDGTAVMTELEVDQLADRWIDAISLGEQQRAAIARAVAANPRLILADEPTSHLDPRRLRMVWDLLRRMATEQGTSVIAATHDPEALLFADRILEIQNGVLA